MNILLPRSNQRNARIHLTIKVGSVFIQIKRGEFVIDMALIQITQPETVNISGHLPIAIKCERCGLTNSCDRNIGGLVLCHDTISVTAERQTSEAGIRSTNINLHHIDATKATNCIKKS